MSHKASTRDVASAISSSNVAHLGVAWTVPLTISTTHTAGADAATPVIVNGVVYVQDLESDVLAISLATGQVLWRLYTDSVVKLSPAGKLLWYYQLTPHDLYDLDLQDPPVLSTADGRPVVIDGGKAGLVIELDAQTGKLLWQRPVGGHEGQQNYGLLTEHATRGIVAAHFCLEPDTYGGIVTPLASNGSASAGSNAPLAVDGG